MLAGLTLQSSEKASKEASRHINKCIFFWSRIFPRFGTPSNIQGPVQLQRPHPFRMAVKYLLYTHKKKKEKKIQILLEVLNTAKVSVLWSRAGLLSFQNYISCNELPHQNPVKTDNAQKMKTKNKNVKFETSNWHVDKAWYILYARNTNTNADLGCLQALFLPYLHFGWSLLRLYTANPQGGGLG